MLGFVRKDLTELNNESAEFNFRVVEFNFRVRKLNNESAASNLADLFVTTVIAVESAVKMVVDAVMLVVDFCGMACCVVEKA
ncbi:MAG: hypothetical protein Q4F69_12330 [Bacteroidia bacterium]|nr:hypothetical protein [Bacteroidia bacterium]